MNNEVVYLPSARKAVSLLAGAVIALVIFVAVGYGKWSNDQIVQIKTKQADYDERLGRIEGKLDVLLDSLDLQYGQPRSTTPPALRQGHQ